MAITQIEEAIYYILSNYANLTALVSTRIYPTALPQQIDPPAVTFFRVSGTHFSAMGSDTGLMETRIQVSSWASTFAMAKQVSDQVRTCMQRWRGVYDSVQVQDCVIDNEMDEYNEDLEIYQIIIDFILWH